MAPVFAIGNIRKAFPMVVDNTKKAIQLLRAAPSNQPFNVDNLAQRLTIDVMGMFGFDQDFKSLSGDKALMLEVIKHCLKGCQDRMAPHHRWFPTKAAREFRKWAGEYDRLVTLFVEEAQDREGSKEGIRDHSVLAHLLKWRDPQTGRKLSKAQLKAETSIFLIAGFETTAHSIAWTLYLLAKHPDVEARLVQELDSLGLLVKPGQTSPERALTWEDLGQMTYLNACINESLRIIPTVAGGTARSVDRDLTHDGVTLAKGAMLWVPTIVAHHNEEVWPNSWEYRPERWMKEGEGLAGADTEGETSSRLPGAFIPFSAGPRNCVGQTLAMLELRVAIATLVGHFAFTLVDYQELDVKTMVLRNGIYEISLKPKMMNMYCHFRGGNS